MNAALLIDAIVRQTTVLIATLATSSGNRAQLAHVADRVFADLVTELKEQGLGHKVIADMFGMALRTYHTRVARLADSGTDDGRSLWESVLAFIQESGAVSRARVLDRFRRDNESVVRGVLRDLVDSELVYQTGRAEHVTYRANEGAGTPDAAATARALEQLVSIAVHRRGPLDRAALGELVPADDAALNAALERLVAQGLVRLNGETYESETCVIPFGDPAGWEAAVFDHYQAVVMALVTKLRRGTRRAELADKVGGSTFVFDLWEGHPMTERALGCLRSMREQGMALRRDLEAFNQAHPKPEQAEAVRVFTYVGQTVIEEEVGS